MYHVAIGVYKQRNVLKFKSKRAIAKKIPKVREKSFSFRESLQKYDSIQRRKEVTVVFSLNIVFLYQQLTQLFPLSLFDRTFKKETFFAFFVLVANSRKQSTKLLRSKNKERRNENAPLKLNHEIWRCVSSSSSPTIVSQTHECET